MMSKYKRLLVAVDHSNMAKSVIESAADLVNEKMDVLLVTVVDYPGTLGAINEEAIIESDLKAAEDWMRELKSTYEHLFAKAKSFNTRVCVGNPSKLIARDIPTEENTDLIVIGKTSRHSLMDQIFLGSTAKAITQDAICDVLVVKTKIRTI